MTVHESAIEWLKKQSRNKDIALYKALHKPNCSEKEKKDIEDAIEVIDYLLQIMEGEEGSCPNKKTEDDALHTLRLIYADFMEGANRMRTRSEQSSMRGRAAEAADLRRDAEIRQHCAYKVVYYCRRIGFDPNPKEE